MTLQARLDDMLAVARRATPGPWWDEDGSIVNRDAPDGRPWDIAEVYNELNRAHIAQSNPAVFAALVEVAKAGDFMRTHESCANSGPVDIHLLREAYAKLEDALKEGA